jgi:hypothetical protein
MPENILKETLVLYAAPVALGAIVIAVRYVYFLFIVDINSKMFTFQIKRLVVANNIDRAIKLCSAAPSALLPQLTKRLLLSIQKDKSFDGDYFLSESRKIALAAVSKSILFHLVSLVGLGISVFLFNRIGMLNHEAFFIPAGFNLYLNLMTFSKSRKILSGTVFSITDVLQTYAEIQEKLKKDSSDAGDIQKNFNPGKSKSTERVFEISPVQSDSSEGSLEFGLGDNEDSSSAQNDQSPVSGERWAVCSNCGAHKVVNDLPGKELSPFNIDEFIDGDCSDCGGGFFTLP